MSKEKLLKRIEQTESELAKLKSELNKSETPTVPFWYLFGNGWLGRITSFEPFEYCRCDNRGGTLGERPKYGNGRLATPEEIESHLIGLMNGRYKKGDVLESTYSKSTVKFSDPAFCNIFYNNHNDILNYDGIDIYNSGKWAEIVPSLPSWDEIFSDYGFQLKDDWVSVIGSTFHRGAYDGRKKMSKVPTFIKLLAVADYVNDGWESQGTGGHVIIVHDGELTYFVYDGDYLPSIVWFKSTEATLKAIDIFKHNGSEKELISFFK